MRRVAIAGVGLTPVGEHWDKSLSDLFVESANKSFDDAGKSKIDALYVANMGAAVFQRQIHLGAMMADALGMSGIPALSVEAASACGGVAFNEAARAVASGLYDSVLVSGVEKTSDALPEDASSSLAMAEDQEYIAYTGITNYGLNALIHRLYMDTFGATPEQVAMLAVRGHEHAEGCTHAQYPFKINIDRIIASPMEADPVHALECSGIGDGSASILLQPAEQLKEGVEVASTAVATSTFHLTERADILTLEAVKNAAEKALSQAGVSREEVDLLEVHDDTTIMGVLSLEDLGFVEKGKGAAFVADGHTMRGGRLPTNTFGGLKARGNPLGATGLYQIAEVAMQLRGQGGKCQVEGARIGLTQNLGGIGSTCSVSILRRF